MSLLDQHKSREQSECSVLKLSSGSLRLVKMKFAIATLSLLATSARAGNVIWNGIFNSSFTTADFDKCEWASVKENKLRLIFMLDLKGRGQTKLRYELCCHA